MSLKKNINFLFNYWIMLLINAQRVTANAAPTPFPFNITFEQSITVNTFDKASFQMIKSYEEPPSTNLCVIAPYEIGGISDSPMLVIEPKTATYTLNGLSLQWCGTLQELSSLDWVCYMNNHPIYSIKNPFQIQLDGHSSLFTPAISIRTPYSWSVENRLIPKHSDCIAFDVSMPDNLAFIASVYYDSPPTNLSLTFCDVSYYQNNPIRDASIQYRFVNQDPRDFRTILPHAVQFPSGTDGYQATFEITLPTGKNLWNDYPTLIDVERQLLDLQGRIIDRQFLSTSLIISRVKFRLPTTIQQSAPINTYTKIDSTQYELNPFPMQDPSWRNGLGEGSNRDPAYLFQINQYFNGKKLIPIKSTFNGDAYLTDLKKLVEQPLFIYCYPNHTITYEISYQLVGRPVNEDQIYPQYYFLFNLPNREIPFFKAQYTSTNRSTQDLYRVEKPLNVDYLHSKRLLNNFSQYISMQLNPTITFHIAYNRTIDIEGDYGNIQYDLKSSKEISEEYLAKLDYFPGYFSPKRKTTVHITVCNRKQAVDIYIPESLTHSFMLLVPLVLLVISQNQPKILNELYDNNFSLAWLDRTIQTKRLQLPSPALSILRSSSRAPKPSLTVLPDHLIILIAKSLSIKEMGRFFQYLSQEGRLTTKTLDYILFLLKSHLKTSDESTQRHASNANSKRPPLSVDELLIALNFLPTLYQKELIKAVMLPSSCFVYTVSHKSSFLKRTWLTQLMFPLFSFFTFLSLNSSLAFRALTKYLSESTSMYCTELTLLSSFCAIMLSSQESYKLLNSFLKIKEWEKHHIIDSSTNNDDSKYFKPMTLNTLKVLMNNQFMKKERQEFREQIKRAADEFSTRPRVEEPSPARLFDMDLEQGLNQPLLSHSN